MDNEWPYGVSWLDFYKNILTIYTDIYQNNSVNLVSQK